MSYKMELVEQQLMLLKISKKCLSRTFGEGIDGYKKYIDFFILEDL